MTDDITLTASEVLTLNKRGHKIIQKLGEGSYAKVYLSEYQEMAGSSKKITTNFACKVIDTMVAPKDFVRKFLQRELDILVKIYHPHIIYVHSIFQHKAKYFIFMRYSEKGDLLDYILQNGALSENRSRFWMHQMALAFEYLHSMGIVHRDLKCENILITASMNIKVADFGFARFIFNKKGVEIVSSTYCGSLLYAAPEILKGTPYEPKPVDLWSLGVILYVMLNKSMPYDDTNVHRLHKKQMSRSMRFRTRVVDILSDKVKNTVRYLLEPESHLRWNIAQLVNSDWIGMDDRLKDMTSLEKKRLQAARDYRINLELGVDEVNSQSVSESHHDSVKVLKKAGKDLYQKSLITGIVEHPPPNK